MFSPFLASPLRFVKAIGFGAGMLTKTLWQGYYKGKITLTDQSNGPVACVQFQMQMVSSNQKEENF